MSGITDIGADAAQESQSNNDSNSDYESDYERFDLDGVSFGKQHPTTAVRGDPQALRKLYDENDPDRADIAVILDDPSVVTGEDALDGTVVVESDEESDQFKVVNLDDEKTKQPSDEMIDFDGNTYYGEVGGEFTAERIALKRGGGAGRSVTSVLDVNGATTARTREDEDGDPILHAGGFPEHNGGLVEYDPDPDGQLPRYARDPELRPDIEGDVIVMIQRLAEVDPDYDGNAYWATVFAQVSDERQSELTQNYADASDDKEPSDFVTELDGDEFVQLKPTDEFDPDEDLVRDTGWIEWNRPDIETLNEAREAEGFDRYEPNANSDETEQEA
jgi:hypothetical protein